MLDKIRYNLKGTSYKISESATGITRGCPNSGCFGYELVDNILLPPTDWVPISVPSRPFKATFEGNGFSIDNLNMTGSNDRDDIGLFGTLGKTAKVQNFNLTGSITGEYHKGAGVKASKKHDSFIGSLVGRTTEGTLINHVSSNVSINIIVKACSYVGGLVGYSQGTIQNSSATGNITGRASLSCPPRGSAGGLVGSNRGSIENSHATGNILFSGQAGSLGGLVGHDSGAISNSSATGSVYNKGSSYYSRLGVGGLVGTSYGTIKNSRAGDIANGIKAGDVGSMYPAGSGGLVGKNFGRITKSYATGDVYSPTRRYRPVTWKSPYGTIGPFLYDDFAYSRIGGLVGYNSESYIHYRCCSITDSFATGNVYGGSHPNEAGGLVGKMSLCVIKRKSCHWQCLWQWGGRLCWRLGGIY